MLFLGLIGSFGSLALWLFLALIGSFGSLALLALIGSFWLLLAL
jgi:hypothetical protein